MSLTEADSLIKTFKIPALSFSRNVFVVSNAQDAFLQSDSGRQCSTVSA